MIKSYPNYIYLVALIFSFNFSIAIAQSPTDPAEGFNVFIENDMTLTTNETDGPAACGEDLTLKGNYQVATNNPGNFTVNGVKIGLLVNGRVNYTSGNALQVNQNAYIKIGNSQGSHVWYYDQNNAASPIRITPSSNYNSSPRIMLQANSNQLNVGVNNNPVFESNLIDFSTAFQTMRASSESISQCTGNAQLTNPNGQSIPTTNLPNQIKINLQNGINYLNVTGADMNNVQVFTYNNQPSASKVLVINVDAPGTFNWEVWNQAGIGLQNCPYIFYNFYNTTTLNIKGNSTIEGTVFAPFADINKTINQSNIEGQIIGKSLIHKGGEMHYAIFTPSLTGCAPVPGVEPTAEFSTSTVDCLDGNQFTMNNTSNTGSTSQPSTPITYEWDFGDGTTSTSMNPTHSYTNTGNYTITLIATNTYGADTTTQQVTVLQAEVADVTVTTAGVGTNTVTKTFTLNNSGDFTNYSWAATGQGNGLFPNQNTVSFDYTQDGYYEVSITTTDNNGCTKTLIIPVTIASGEVGSGSGGGLESESLGDAVSKQYVQRKKNGIPTNFDKAKAEIFDKQKFKPTPTTKGSNAQTMLDMFPTQLTPGDVAHVSSPTDILDYTVAEEVLSVDFSVDGSTKAVVLGVKTENKIYNHTKASCDRLKGAEILNVKAIEIGGYNFLTQAIHQKNGNTEYAISFVVGFNENDSDYTLQSNWYVNTFTPAEEVYNFQVWSTTPEATQKLVQDILNNLISYQTIVQTEIQEVPKTYASKITREGVNMIVDLKSLRANQNIEVILDEVYSETGGYAQRYNPLKSELEQTLVFEIKDGYEYDGLIKVNGEVQDAFYHADGNWGLDYDPTYTSVNEYEVYNDFNRVYNDDELAIHRNVRIKAHSEYDYLTMYKSLLPGSEADDYTDYNYISFTAKGSGLLELGLVKSSIDNWKEQYKAMIDVKEEEQTYYIPFEYFASTASLNSITADDLTLLTFTFLPVEAQTNDLDLTLEDVKFTKTAPDGYENMLMGLENEMLAYPNPSIGNVNCVIYSEDEEHNAEVTVHDLSGKLVYTKNVDINKGRNEIELDLNKVSGLVLLNVRSEKTNFGTINLVVQ